MAWSVWRLGASRFDAAVLVGAGHLGVEPERLGGVGVGAGRVALHLEGEAPVPPSGGVGGFQADRYGEVGDGAVRRRRRCRKARRG